MRVSAARPWPYTIRFHGSHIRQWRCEAGVTDHELRVMAEYVLDEVLPMRGWKEGLHMNRHVDDGAGRESLAPSPAECKATIWRRAKPGELIKSGAVVFEVTEVVDGHVWGNVTSSLIPGECCRICGMMRRRDKTNKPCRGPVEVTLR